MAHGVCPPRWGPPYGRSRRSASGTALVTQIRAPDRCRGFLDYFFAPGADADWIAEFLAFDDQVGAEDTGLVEAAQAGAGSGLVEDGYLLGHDEQLIAHFQAYVRDRLT